MVEHPTALIEDFVASGADLITIHAEVGKSEAAAAIQAIRHASRISIPFDALLAARYSAWCQRPGSGADIIVPESLVFQSRQMAETFSWLRAL